MELLRVVDKLGNDTNEIIEREERLFYEVNKRVFFLNRFINSCDD